MHEPTLPTYCIQLNAPNMSLIRGERKAQPGTGILNFLNSYEMGLVYEAI